MADWTCLQLIDNVDLHEDAQGTYAQARFRMAAADREFRPHRGDAADLLVPGWIVDKVAVTAFAPHVDYVSVTARPSIAVGISFDRENLRSLYHISFSRRDFLFSSAVLGVQPLPPRPTDGSPWSAEHVNLGSGVPGHAPIQRDPADPTWLLDWPAAAQQPPAASPFTHTPAWQMHQQSARCEVSTIVFHARANFLSRYLDFGGVTDGSPACIPTRFHLPDATAAGVWRGIDQSIETVRDATGRDFWEITRILLRVPPIADTNGQPLRWAPEKHGGAMRWLRA